MKTSNQLFPSAASAFRWRRHRPARPRGCNPARCVRSGGKHPPAFDAPVTPTGSKPASIFGSGRKSDLDLHLDTRRKLQLHQRVDRLRRRRVDVQDAFERAELELLAGLLVHEGRAVHRENLLVRGKGHGAAHNGARTLHGLHNLLGRLVHEIVIE